MPTVSYCQFQTSQFQKESLSYFTNKGVQNLGIDNDCIDMLPDGS